MGARWSEEDFDGGKRLGEGEGRYLVLMIWMIWMIWIDWRE